MLEAKIVNTGPGPEIARTRITVYDVISTRSHAPRLSFPIFWYHGWLNSTSTLMDGANYVHMDVNSPGRASGMGSDTVRWDQAWQLREEETHHGVCGGAC
jgi:hypothetical protein